MNTREVAQDGVVIEEDLSIRHERSEVLGLQARSRRAGTGKLTDQAHGSVMAGGNGGGAGSEFAANQYRTWLNGEYLTISFRRDELDEHTTWRLEP